MLDLIVNPLLYVLFLAAYVVGFVDPDEPSDREDGWTYAADAAFWIGAALAAVLFATHGALGGAVALLGAWGASIVGVRRGILAQRNALWETVLWTMPLELFVARGTPAPVPADARVEAPVRSRRQARVHTIEWRLPALADVLPNRGRRLTMLGITMDLAACVVVMSALSLLAR